MYHYGYVSKTIYGKPRSTVTSQLPRHRLQPALINRLQVHLQVYLRMRLVRHYVRPNATPQCTWSQSLPCAPSPSGSGLPSVSGLDQYKCKRDELVRATQISLSEANKYERGKQVCVQDEWKILARAHK